MCALVKALNSIETSAEMMQVRKYIEHIKYIEY